MARRRDYRAEAARRNELARERGYASYYQERLARARRAHPRISTAAARGHASAQEKEVARLIRRIKRMGPGDQIAFTGIDRQPDGTWKRGWFDIIPADDPLEVYVIDADVLMPRLSEIADAAADTGIAVIGAQYMAKMAE